MEPRTPRLHHGETGSRFTAFGAFGVVCAAMGTMLVGTAVAMYLGAPIMLVAVIAQAIMLAVPMAVMVASGRRWAAIGLRRPVSHRFYLAAALIGASAWYLNLRLVELLPFENQDVQLVELIDRPSTLAVLLAIGVAPAICEEVLFRGVLVRGLATRFVLLFALVIGAFVFSLYHLRVVQLVPTFTLGLLLGYLAIRADSAVPGMLAHFANNTIALLVARGDAPLIADAFGGYPEVALAGCLFMTSAGIALCYTTCEPHRRESQA